MEETSFDRLDERGRNSNNGGAEFPGGLSVPWRAISGFPPFLPESRARGRSDPGAMRVVAGIWRGRTIRASKGPAVRPTTDRVREAVFSILGSAVEGSVVLDLFAGTGAMAIEALSRGAAEAVLVESSPAPYAAMKGNLEALGAARAVGLPLDYREAVRRLSAKERRFTLVFLDPPYGKGLVGRSSALLSSAGILAPGAVVVAERAARDPEDAMPAGWNVRVDRRYGDTRITLYDIPDPRGTDAPGRREEERR